MRKLRWSLGVSVCILASCKTPQKQSGLTSQELAEGDKGALIKVDMDGRVGVLLDEIPTKRRETYAKTLLGKKSDYWEARARRQLALTTYRLVFRNNFYSEQSRYGLPLPPPSVQKVTIKSSPTRESIDGHDYVIVDYQLSTYLITSTKSAAESEPDLATVGGVWNEPFNLPADPELLVQRTGFACIDEAEFPPNSVDTEDVEFFYDQECQVEAKLSDDGCHRTELPKQSCDQALETSVGRMKTQMRYERLAWDDRLAEQYRVGEIKNRNGADLEVLEDELGINRVIYRYFPSTSCSIAEACVGGPGWRRLLQFNASSRNLGTEPVHIGDVDYFIAKPKPGTATVNHNIFEYSQCHNHYHFSHYGQFTLEGLRTKASKQAFCLESVLRYSNNEYSPLYSPYHKCQYQGISAGWGDQYNAGLECQWIDITDVDTSKAPVNRALTFHSNPDGFLCEGKPIYDESGNLGFEPTEFRTAKGEVVDRPKCDFMKNWDQNNRKSTPVMIPVSGEGLTTSACDRGQIGPKRNCGFKYAGKVNSCKPGTKVTLSCNNDASKPSQVVRVCEASKVLGVGIACALADAIVTKVVEGPSEEVSFTCPIGRDEQETGGVWAIYTGGVIPEDGSSIQCNVR